MNARGRIGAHMSVAGGVSKAVDNASQWRARPIDSSEIRRFRRRVDDTGLTPVVSHGSYLINLATTSPALRELSIAALIDELDRAQALGLLGVVLHPGTCTAGTVADALRLVADAVRRAFRARPRRRTGTATRSRPLAANMKEMKGMKAMKKGIPANPLHDLHCLHDLHVCLVKCFSRPLRPHVEKSAISVESAQRCLSAPSGSTLAALDGRCLWSRVHSLKPSSVVDRRC